jgi:DNA primase
MPSIDFSELRRRISMAQVLGLLGFVPIKVRGAQQRGHCPVHGQSASLGRAKRKQSAPFSVNLHKQAYQCFECGSKGNTLKLWASVHKLPLYPAALDLCQALGIAPPLLPPRHRSTHL